MELGGGSQRGKVIPVSFLQETVPFNVNFHTVDPHANEYTICMHTATPEAQL